MSTFKIEYFGFNNLITSQHCVRLVRHFTFSPVRLTYSLVGAAFAYARSGSAFTTFNCDHPWSLTSSLSLLLNQVHWRTLILHHFVLRSFPTCVTLKFKWTTPSVIPRTGNLRTLRLLSTKNLVTLVYIYTAITSPLLVTTSSQLQTLDIRQGLQSHD